MFRGATALTLSLALPLAFAGCQPPATEADEAPSLVQQDAAPEYLNPNARSPYSEGVRYGGLLFLAGKLGGGGERGIQPETRIALESIQDALERFGSSMDRVVKCSVFLADMAEWGAMNEVYSEFFPENKPARTAVGAGLAGGARVEIECMAAA
ncbi:MAG: RidA family protein [Gemmatimonadetes bacterium]|jgi:enamine deaminase RidA (YjgF/YER057c/UK114 family)|nr:RidA family protein [Gemmatimonadota bacterium]